LNNFFTILKKKIYISIIKKMDNVVFGKQQFVGKVTGAVTDHYQMLKVR